MYDRRPSFWVDQPPPERNPELGIGKNVAWQTPHTQRSREEGAEGDVGRLLGAARPL